MRDSDFKVSSALSWLQLGFQQVDISGDLVKLKYSLKALRSVVDKTLEVVNTELDSTRQTRRERDRNLTL